MRTLLLTITLLAVILLCTPGSSGDNPKEEGFQSLFNGRDLTGWTYKGQALDGKTATPDQRFQVVDEAIVTPGGNGNLYTTASFDSDFQLKLEFRASPKSDSGVFVRGPQLQVRDFIRRKEHMHLEKAFKNDDWNELDITVNSTQSTTTVNGKQVTRSDSFELTVKDGKPSARLNGKDIDVNTVQVARGVTVCKLNGIAFDPTYKAGAKGPIGLQAETGKFEFRNVRIKMSR